MWVKMDSASILSIMRCWQSASKQRIQTIPSAWKSYNRCCEREFLALSEICNGWSKTDYLALLNTLNIKYSVTTEKHPSIAMDYVIRTSIPAGGYINIEKGETLTVVVCNGKAAETTAATKATTSASATETQATSETSAWTDTQPVWTDTQPVWTDTEPVTDPVADYGNGYDNNGY